MKPSAPVKRLCPVCKSKGIKTPVERYRNISLTFCTYHYWLMKAGPEGMKLEDYVKSSQANAFKTSLPSSQDIEILEGRP